MLIRAAVLLAILSLPGCAPVVVPAGPATQQARIEVPFAPPALPWAFRPAWAFAPSPPEPQPSGPLPEASLVMTDGARLPLRAWHPSGPPRFVVLALHGLADHGGNFLEDSGPMLAAGGALVYAYDQRGFGWNVARGYWPGIETLVSDARQATALLAARHPGMPLYILGESMGGAVAVLASPPEATGFLLSSPAIWSRQDMPGVMRAALAVAARVAPGAAGAPAAGGIAPSDNIAALVRMGRDPLVLRFVRVDVLFGLVNLMDAAVAALPGCCAGRPTLVLFGAKDQVIPPGPARRAMRAAATPRVALYQEGWHLLLRDNIRQEVVRDMLAFMAAPEAPLPAEAAGRAWLDGS